MYPGFLYTDALAVARQAELRTVDVRQTVFSQGEIGENLYFVLQGSVAIKINNKVIKILSAKTAFGELAMQYKCRRSASVLGGEDATRLLVIRKKLYQRHLAKTHRKEMASKLEFIKKLNAAQLKPDQLAILCTCIKMQKVIQSQKICSSNGAAEFLYYLIEGRAEQHSCDNGDLLRELLQPTAKKHDRPTRKTRNSKRKNDKPEMHRLATLLSGQMFGEASWVHGQQVMTTVVARTNCKLWVLSLERVNELVLVETKVKEHLEKVARMKLHFRLKRLNTFYRAKKCLQPALTNRTLETKAWAGIPPSIKKAPSSLLSTTLAKKKSSSSSYVTLAVDDGTKDRRSMPIVPRARPATGLVRTERRRSMPIVPRARPATGLVRMPTLGNFFATAKSWPLVSDSGAEHKGSRHSSRKKKIKTIQQS